MISSATEHLLQNLEVLGSGPTWVSIFHMFVPTSAYAVKAELSYLGVGWEGNSNTAQPFKFYEKEALYLYMP